VPTFELSRIGNVHLTTIIYMSHIICFCWVT